MKSKNFLRTVYLSDVHNFNRKTPTQKICDNMEEVLFHKLDFKTIDILFITGDFFDREVPYYHDEICIVENFIVKLLIKCKENDVILRVLEGTPSHDRKQPAAFIKLNKNYSIDADVKWVQELSIEYIEKVDKRILYVPDEWGEGPESTLVEVKNMINHLPGGKVDIAVMHGNFPHQLPSHLKFPMHDPVAYQSLVNSVVVIGHVHLFSNFENIFAPGSFDRISQGEEGAKGLLLIDINRDNTYEAKFIENKNAKIYKKIDCSGLDLDSAYKLIDQTVKKTPPGSEILISCNKEDAILQSGDIYPFKYPDIHWRIEAVVEKKKIDKEAFKRESLLKVGNELTSSNIKLILFGRITGKNTDPELIQTCKTLLEEMT